LKRLMVLSAAVGAAMTVLGAGVAGAQGSPDVSGKTFSDASTTLQNAGYTAKVATTVGSQLTQGDCVVTSQVDTPASTSYGPSQFKTAKAAGAKTVLLSLNCNATLASATDPGNSAASPGGQKEKKLEEGVAWERTPEGQQWCKDTKTQHPDWGWSTDKGLQGCAG
jgi:hypothetical protein